MPNASRVIIKDEDNSYQALGALTGISGFIGTFERGPINDPSIIFTSALELRKVHGGYVTGSDDYLLAERILNRGGKLRVVNIRHYTDVSDPATLTATKSTAITIKGTDDGDPVTLFTLQPKYEGAKYNDLKVQILAPSNGQDALGYFNLRLYIDGDSFYTTEEYNNLRITGK